jgi:hypothetical protein
MPCVLQSAELNSRQRRGRQHSLDAVIEGLKGELRLERLLLAHPLWVSYSLETPCLGHWIARLPTPERAARV